MVLKKRCMNNVCRCVQSDMDPGCRVLYHSNANLVNDRMKNRHKNSSWFARSLHCAMKCAKCCLGETVPLYLLNFGVVYLGGSLTLRYSYG